jgi:uncharacterized protein YqgV (UPF0045/DUF77 family)
MTGTLKAELTLEPFVDGHPGPYVEAVVDIGRMSGLDVEFGPFGTSVEGPEGEVLATVQSMLLAALAAGATRVSLQLETD